MVLDIVYGVKGNTKLLRQYVNERGTAHRGWRIWGVRVCQLVSLTCAAILISLVVISSMDSEDAPFPPGKCRRHAVIKASMWWAINFFTLFSQLSGLPLFLIAIVSNRSKTWTLASSTYNMALCTILVYGMIVGSHELLSGSYKRNGIEPKNLPPIPPMKTTTPPKPNSTTTEAPPLPPQNPNHPGYIPREQSLKYDNKTKLYDPSWMECQVIMPKEMPQFAQDIAMLAGLLTLITVFAHLVAVLYPQPFPKYLRSITLAEKETKKVGGISDGLEGEIGSPEESGTTTATDTTATPADTPTAL